MKKLLLLLLLLTVTASGTDYYVATTGDNGAAGTEGAPWLTINKATSVAVAGDTVYVREGSYREQVVFPAGHSGTVGNLVTLRNYVGETPTIDGSEVVTGWTQCTSAEDVNGNSNWANIFYAYLPVGTTLFSANLFQNDQRLSIAQYPNMSDIFWVDDYTEYITPDAITTTSVTDTDLDTYGGSDLVGSWVAIYHTGALGVSFKEITAYNTETKTISFTNVGNVPVKYSLFNNLDEDVLDRAGEYSIDENSQGDGTFKVWLWPLDSCDLSASGEVTVSARNQLISGGTERYIKVQGFNIVKGKNQISGWDTCTNITIQDCNFFNNKCDIAAIKSCIYVVSDVNFTFQDNTVHDNQGRHWGFQSLNSANTLCTGNTFYNVGGTTIYYGNVDVGQILNNTIYNCTGVHSNGMTCYTGCSDILIASNNVRQTNVCFTWQTMGGNLLIYNNLFDGYDLVTTVIGNWGSHTNGYVYLLNNIIVNSTNESSNHLGAMPNGEYSLNNILDGDNDWCTIEGVPPYSDNYAVRTNNIYTNYGTYQTAFYGWSLGAGEVYQPDANVLFNDPYPNVDYTTAAESNSIDAGADLTTYLADWRVLFPDYDFDVDLAGNARDVNAPDIGAYEYAELSDTTPPVPNPASFSTPPAAVDATSITMTATAASDVSTPVQYSFVETSGNTGGTSSGWQASATYTDTGLLPNTQYTYTVQTRDSVPNAGTASGEFSATTQAVRVCPVINIMRFLD